MKKRTTERLYFDLEQHLKADKEAFEKIESSHRRIHDRLDSMATKDDLGKVLVKFDEMFTAFQTAKLGYGLFQFSIKNLAKVGGVILILIAGFKAFIAWFGFNIFK